MAQQFSTTGTSTSPNGSDQAEEPTNPYDTERLRYSEAEFTHDEVASKKVTTAIKVRKPAKQEWFRLHPSQEYQLPTALFLRENEELLRPETYLVLPEYRHLFRSGLTPVRLRLAINSLDTEFLWDMRVPKGGLMTDYYLALQEAADEAEKSWVKLEWNNGSRVYDYHYAVDDFGDPQFTEGRTMSDWLALGFKGDRLINREDHPVVLEYHGRKV
ncbi:MAG: hypothetical protein ACXVB2_25605 [Isosphaeraceae bacterium]